MRPLVRCARGRPQTLERAVAQPALAAMFVLPRLSTPSAGIKGGARVTLLVLAGNVGPTCPVGIIPNADDTAVSACATLADGMRAFLAGMDPDAPIGSYETGAIASP